MKRSVNMKRVWIIVAGAAALMIAYSLNYVPTHSPHPAIPEYSKVLAGANAYRDSLKEKGAPIPASVTLQELTERGFLRHSDVNGFDGMQVTISLKTPTETRPQDSFLRVGFPDGREVAVLGDGSVQEMRR
jgi:hypothetical protein